MNIVPLHFASVRSNAASSAFATDRSPVLSSTSALGMVIVAVVPALFWTGIVWATSYVFDWNVSATTLASIATAISVFLGVVCSAIIATA